MLNKIIYYSLHNRLVVLVCALLLMIWGRVLWLVQESPSC